MNEVFIKIWGGDEWHISLDRIKNWFVVNNNGNSVRCYLERGQKIRCNTVKGMMFDVEFVPMFYLLKENEEPYIIKDHFRD